MTQITPTGPARRSRRKVTAALVAAGAVGATTAAIALPVASVTAVEGSTIQILSFNDYHGHIEDDTAGSIDGSFGGPAAGGGEYLSAKLAELRAASDADATFTVAAGDNIGGSPFFSGLARDEPSVESLNEMGLDISGVGNHEFDDGVDELLRMQNGGCFDTDGDMAPVGTDDADDCFFPADPYGGADFQWLAANVFDENGTPGDLADDFPLDLDDAKGDYEDLGGYSIVDADGTDIAFIGMTLDGTDELVSAAGIAGYRFADEVETANALVTEIQTDNPGVEAIFVLLHEGGIPTEFAIDGCVGISGPIVAINEGLSAEIDGVISGHTQQPYNCTLEGRPVISAWEYGKVVSEMTFDIDADGDVDRSTFEVVNHPVLQSDLTADPAVTAVIDKWSPLIEDLANDEVGRVSEDITRGGDPSGTDRGVESDAGNLVADAQLAGMRDFGLDADVAFMNPGGIRSDLEFAATDPETEDGIVRYGEAFTFQPFNNTMLVLPMTGAQIQTILEEQCQPSDSSRPFLHLGVSDGFTYDLATTSQAGVCTSIDVTNVELDGTPVEAGTTYDVVVNNFLADGGDNFNTFADIGVADRTDSGLTDLEVLIAYFEDEGTVDPPGTDRVNETLTTLPTPPTAVDPVRLLETRIGDEFTTDDGDFEGIGRIPADTEVELLVQGRGGVSESATAANLQVGAVFPDGSGYITMYPCSDETDRPVVSSLNYNGEPAVSNSITTSLSEDGTVCIYTLKETDLYVDVNGYVSPDGSPVAVDPVRLLDDREGDLNDGTFDDLFVGGGPLEGDSILELDVVGREDIVPADAKAVLLNVVAVQPLAGGFIAVFPCDDTSDEPPLASSINYVPAGDFANGVITGLGDDGQVCIYSSQTTNLVVDLNGYVPADGTPDPVTPFRLVDTRDGDDFSTIDGDFEGDGPLAAETVLEINVTGRDDSVPAGAASAYLNVAVVDATGSGFFTVFPCNDDDEVPNASNVNYDVGETVANSVQVPLTEDGTVCVFSSQTTDFVMDVTGFVSPVIPARPAVT